MRQRAAARARARVSHARAAPQARRGRRTHDVTVKQPQRLRTRRAPARGDVVRKARSDGAVEKRHKRGAARSCSANDRPLDLLRALALDPCLCCDERRRNSHNGKKQRREAARE